MDGMARPGGVAIAHLLTYDGDLDSVVEAYSGYGGCHSHKVCEGLS